MAERKVTFEFGAQVDSRAKQVIQQFSADIATAQERVNKSAKPDHSNLQSIREFSNERRRIERATVEAMVLFRKMAKEKGIEDEKALAAGVMAIAKDAKSRLQALERAQSGYLRRESGLRLQQELAAQRQSEQAARVSLQRRLGDYKRAKAEEAKAAKDAAAQSDSYSSGRIARNRAMIPTTQLSIDQGPSAGPIQSPRAIAAREMREQFSELGESVMRVARGITLLGLVGEKDINKIKDALMGTQAAFDIFGGSLKVVSKLERAWSAYNKMILAGKAAQDAYNASAAVGAAIQAGGSLAAGRGNVARGAGSAAGGMGMAVGTGLAAGGAGGLAGWLTTNIRGIFGTAARTVATPANYLRATAAGTTTVAGTGLRGMLGSTAGRLGFSGAASASPLGAGLAGSRAIPILGQMIGAGAAGYSVGSALSSVSTAPIGTVVGRNFGAMKSTKDTAKMEKATELALQMRLGIENQINDKLAAREGIEQRMQGMIAQSNALRLEGTKSAFDSTSAIAASELKIADLRSKMARTQNASAKIYLASQIAAQEASQAQIAGQKQMLDDAAKAAEVSRLQTDEAKKQVSLRIQLNSLTEAESALRDNVKSQMEASGERMIKLTEQRGQLERQIARTRADTARAALEASKRELETVANRVATERDALKSAEERFGSMSRTEQDEVLQLLKQARAGKQLDSSQVGKLRSLGTIEAENLASKQARNLVKGDYSPQSQQVAALEAKNKELEFRILEVRDGKVNRYNVQEAPRGSRASREDKIEELRKQIEMNETRAEAIRRATRENAELRQSVFGGERANLARSLTQQSTIEAKISQQITVVAKFDNVAQQAADAATRQMLTAVGPWMQEFEKRMNQNVNDVNKLKNLRRQTVPGRG